MLMEEINEPTGQEQTIINIGNDPVVAKLQPFGVGKISEISGKSELSSASTRIRRDYW